MTSKFPKLLLSPFLGQCVLCLVDSGALHVDAQLQGVRVMWRTSGEYAILARAAELLFSFYSHKELGANWRLLASAGRGHPKGTP